MTATAFDNALRARSSDRLPLAFVMAMLMHALLLAALMLSVQWRTQPAAPVTAELWAALPAAATELARPPEPEAAPGPAAPPPTPAVETVATPDIALDAPRKPAPKADPVVSRPIEPVKDARKAEAKKTEKAEAKKTPANPPEARVPESAPRTDLDRLMAQATGAPGGAKGAPAAGSVRGSDPSLSSRVIGCIQPHIVFTVPPGTLPSSFAEFRVELLPDASIAKIKLLRPSGLPGYDAAAERAIRRCDPFPRKRDGTVERVIDVTMYPVDPA